MAEDTTATPVDPYASSPAHVRPVVHKPGAFHNNSVRLSVARLPLDSQQAGIVDIMDIALRDRDFGYAVGYDNPAHVHVRVAFGGIPFAVVYLAIADW